MEKKACKRCYYRRKFLAERKEGYTFLIKVIPLNSRQLIDEDEGFMPNFKSLSRQRKPRKHEHKAVEYYEELERIP